MLKLYERPLVALSCLGLETKSHRMRRIKVRCIASFLEGCNELSLKLTIRSTEHDRDDLLVRVARMRRA